MFDITTRDIKYLQGVGPQRATVLNKELNLFSFVICCTIFHINM